MSGVAGEAQHTNRLAKEESPYLLQVGVAPHRRGAPPGPGAGGPCFLLCVPAAPPEFFSLVSREGLLLRLRPEARGRPRGLTALVDHLTLAPPSAPVGLCSTRTIQLIGPQGAASRCRPGALSALPHPTHFHPSCCFRYPWGQDAFDKARAEGKPIFLSIGYSTCHWWELGAACSGAPSGGAPSGSHGRRWAGPDGSGPLPWGAGAT